MIRMRQRGPPAASPIRNGDNVPHRRRQSANTSSWEILTRQESEDSSSDNIQTVQYPTLYQNHHRKHVALQNVHLFYRTPLHVSDAQYRAFLGMPKPSPPAPLSRQCCLNVCIVFSWVAVGFLLFVYLILRFQPLYIPHALAFQYITRNGKTIKVSDPSSSPLAIVALHTMIAYLIVALVCHYYANPNRARKSAYQDIPDHNLTRETALPSVNAPPIGVYQESFCDRTWAGVRQWMLVKGIRRGKRKQFGTKTV